MTLCVRLREVGVRTGDCNILGEVRFVGLAAMQHIGAWQLHGGLLKYTLMLAWPRMAAP